MSNDRNTAYDRFVAEEKALAADPKPMPLRRGPSRQIQADSVGLSHWDDDRWGLASFRLGNTKLRHVGYLAMFAFGWMLQNNMVRDEFEGNELRAFDRSAVAVTNLAQIRKVATNGDVSFVVKATVRNNTQASVTSLQAYCAEDATPSTDPDPNYSRPPRLVVKGSGAHIRPGTTGEIEVTAKLEFQGNSTPSVTPASLPRYRCLPGINTAFDRDEMLKAVRR
jgi:hypothetical protein